ncbi:hypothetical protein GCM10022254_55390 [Actinomadura meridiana]|uniref:Uncharacterized protein n=1 Tax=Actinomadura meridiana TaxID=559626 RepID=A0ABP8CG78_9ACTN
MEPFHGRGQDAFLVVNRDDDLDEPAPSGRHCGRAACGGKVTHATEVRRRELEGRETRMNAG